MPQRIDIEIWRGNSSPLITWPLPVGFDPQSATAEVTIWYGDARLVTADREEGLLVDATSRQITLNLSVEQSRLIPLGRSARYELELWSLGREETVYFGTVTGKGGDNNDGPRPLPDGSLDFSNPGNTALYLMGWI